MKIVFFGLDLNRPFQPTAARMAYELSKEFSKKGHKVFIITKGSSSYMEGPVRVIGLQFNSFPTSKNTDVISKTFSKIGDIDIINGVGGLYSMFFGSILFKNFKTPYIHTLTTGGFPSIPFNRWKIKSIFDFTLDLGLRNPLVTSSNIFWSPQLMKSLYGDIKIKSIIAPSMRLLSYIKSSHILNNDCKLYHIPFGVDANKFKSIDMNQKNEYSKIIYYGHANRHRGFYTLIKSFKILQNKLPEIKLEVFSPTNPPFSIRDNKNINIHVGIKNKIDHYISNAKIIALPFNYAIPEFPLTILESMACSKVVISTNILGIPEIIEDNINGHLINPYNYKELLSKLMHIFNDEPNSDNIGRSARRSILKYDWKNVSKIYLKAYEGILN